MRLLWKTTFFVLLLMAMVQEVDAGGITINSTNKFLDFNGVPHFLMASNQICTYYKDLYEPCTTSVSRNLGMDATIAIQRNGQRMLHNALFSNIFLIFKSF